MSKNFIMFLNAGIYESEEQAKEIAETLLISTAITPKGYGEMVVAIESKFNPPVIEDTEEPLPEETVTEV